MTPSRWEGGGATGTLKRSLYGKPEIYLRNVPDFGCHHRERNVIPRHLFPDFSGTENHCRHLVPNVGNAISHQAFDPRFYGNRKLLPTFSSRRRKNNPGSHSNNHYDYRVIVEMANYPPCEATQVLNAKRCANPVAWKMKLGIANILAETTWRKLTQMT